MKDSTRRVVRTVVALLGSLAALLPVVVVTAGLDKVPALAPYVAGAVAVAAAVTRVLALPQVDAFLARFLPWLAAAESDDSLGA